MISMNINKKGVLTTNINSIKYLVNNFSLSNTLVDWTFDTNTFVNGVVLLTGTNPSFTSKTFTVNPTDIICFEFIISVPVPSTKTTGGGIYLGTKTSQGVSIYSFNPQTKIYTQISSNNNNPYFLSSYNKNSTLILKNYILGSSVNLIDVPWGETTDASYPPKAIQLPSGITSTNIRTGYNSGNSTMEIHFSNPKIYNITLRGFYDNNNITSVKFGNNFVLAHEIYEY